MIVNNPVKRRNIQRACRPIFVDPISPIAPRNRIVYAWTFAITVRLVIAAS